MDIRKSKAAVIDALEDIKAKNILMLNVSRLTSLFDYLVIATGDSNRQTKALANHVKEKLKAGGATVYGSEGEETGEWVLVDLGDIVVHIMQPVTRDYYRLEELWRDGKVEFPKPIAKTVAAVKQEKPKAVVKPRAKVAATTVKKKTTTRKPAATGRKPATARSATEKSPATRKPAATKKPATARTVGKAPVAKRKTTAKGVAKPTAKRPAIKKKSGA